MAAIKTLVVGAVLVAWTVLVVGSGPTLRVLGELCAGTYLMAVGYAWLTTVTRCAWTAPGSPTGASILAAPMRSALFWQAAVLVLLAVAGTAPLDARAIPIGAVGLAFVLLLAAAAAGLAEREHLLVLHPRVVAALAPIVLYLALWGLWAASRAWSAPWVELHFTAGLTAALALAGLLLVRRVASGEGGEVGAPPTATAAGWTFMPLALPAMAVVAVRSLPVAQAWDGVLAAHGQVALLFLAALPGLLPAAMLVAWGLDGLHGKPGGRGLALGAVLALLLLAGLEPDLVWSIHGAPGAYADMPVAGLPRAASLMLLASAGLATFHLRRLGRTGSAPSLAGLAAVLVGMLLGALWLVPRFGPEGAGWAAAGAALVGWLVDLACQPRPSRAGTAAPTVTAAP